jgi:tRNA(Ile)-lysidine synthase TilS/MesJ
MVQKCSMCSNTAITLRFDGKHYCEQHFSKIFENEIERHAKRNELISDNDKIGVAVSGGKDSSAMLYVLAKIFDNTEFIAVTVDQGIDGYRKGGIELTKKMCRELGIKLHTIDMKQIFGVTVDEIAGKIKDSERICVYCGELRRLVADMAASKLGVDKVAVGYTLDDMFRISVNSIIRSEPFKMFQYTSACFPTRNMLSNFDYNYPQQILPMRCVTEREIALYVKVNGIQIDPFDCPYPQQETRGSPGWWRYNLTKVMNELSLEFPDVRQRLLRNIDEHFLPLYESMFMEASDIKSQCVICKKPMKIGKTFSISLICDACLGRAGIKNIKDVIIR